MKRVVLSSVIAMTLGVSVPALADGAKDAPAAPVVTPPATPGVATPKVPTAAAPAAPDTKTAAQPAAATAPKTPDAKTVAPAPAPVAPQVAPVVAQPAQAPAAPAPQAPAAAPVAPAPAAAAPAPAADAATTDSNLGLRPTRPLTLQAEPAPTPWYYKLLFGAAVLGAGYVVYKKKRANAADPAKKKTPPMKVLGKTSTGLRGEIALVEVGGMRLVIGITPSSMQTLAVLPDDASLEDSVAAAAAVEANVAAADEAKTAATAATPGRRNDSTEIATRARSLFAALDMSPAQRKPAPAAFSASRYETARDMDDEAPESAPAPSPAPKRRRAPTASSAAAREAALEGQARGLALAMRNTKQ